MNYKIYQKCPAVFFVLLVLPLITGCNGQGHQVESVTGKVTYKGEPLSDAQISFHPKGSGGFVAVASTGTDGTFTLVTAGAIKPGAIIGEYNVLVTKVIAVDTNGRPLKEDTALEEQRPQKPQMESESTSVNHPRPKMQSVIPEKYGQLDKPQLQATVVKGKNNFLFELVP
jgi:hypothetical protein